MNQPETYDSLVDTSKRVLTTCVIMTSLYYFVEKMLSSNSKIFSLLPRKLQNEILLKFLFLFISVSLGIQGYYFLEKSLTTSRMGPFYDKVASIGLGTDIFEMTSRLFSGNLSTETLPLIISKMIWYDGAYLTGYYKPYVGPTYMFYLSDAIGNFLWFLEMSGKVSAKSTNGKLLKLLDLTMTIFSKFGLLSIFYYNFLRNNGILEDPSNISLRSLIMLVLMSYMGVKFLQSSLKQFKNL